MAWTNTYDTVTPDGGDDPAEADDRIREAKAALQERLNVEHVFDLTGTEVSHANTGKHTAITTTSIVNAGALANTGNLTLNTDKFTVDAATGNVVVAGTLGVTGVATVAKGSLLASSDAPTTDAMIANKKYVDDTAKTGADAMHDAEGGYTNVDLNGTKTKVYTKYLTGNLDADISTSVAHGVTATKILSVTVITYNDNTSQYQVSDFRQGLAGTLAFDVYYDTTNIIVSGVGALVQGNAYRIKIDYNL